MLQTHKEYPCEMEQVIQVTLQNLDRCLKLIDTLFEQRVPITNYNRDFDMSVKVTLNEFKQMAKRDAVVAEMKAVEFKFPDIKQLFDMLSESQKQILSKVSDKKLFNKIKLTFDTPHDFSYFDEWVELGNDQHYRAVLANCNN